MRECEGRFTDECFAAALAVEVTDAALRLYDKDNWDRDARGRLRGGFRRRAIYHVNRLAERLGISVLPHGNYAPGISDLLNDYGRGLSELYRQLPDEESRRTLVKIMAYRTMGFRKVKLPQNSPEYWRKRDRVACLRTGHETIAVGFRDWLLGCYDLRPVGYPLQLFTDPESVVTMFQPPQYACQRGSVRVDVCADDVVIDAGACWGDSSLLFALGCGPSGKVYAFEFLEQNLQVLDRNLRLNPELRSRIEVVTKAVWVRSDEKLFFSAAGPANRVAAACLGSEQETVSTVSIDDFVRTRAIPKVDFIKMDIEGAELAALKGADEVLRKHRPDLAISLYHKISDFVDIPMFLANLGVGYTFLLGHTTIHEYETVLYATVRGATDRGMVGMGVGAHDGRT